MRGAGVLLLAAIVVPSGALLTAPAGAAPGLGPAAVTAPVVGECYDLSDARNSFDPGRNGCSGPGGTGRDVVYRIVVTNTGGASGTYTLTDAPDFDNDIAVNLPAALPALPAATAASAPGELQAELQRLRALEQHQQRVRAALASGFQPLSLGPRILRAETAAVAATAVVTAAAGW